jgi:hypothetical protein
MTSRDFAYWLQGFFEVTEPTTMTAEQVDMVRKHLNLVFIHEIDPSIDKGDPAVKAKLDAVHNGVVRPTLGDPVLVPEGALLPPHLNPATPYPPGMRPRC